MSAIFHYLVCHPDLIAQPNQPLLVGSQDAQCTSFNCVLKKTLKRNKNQRGVPLCEAEFSLTVKECTMYRWKKCAHTKMNCGSTAGPTSAAVCLREGKSLGTSRDPYIAQEAASDRVTGRILAGLPINLPEFVVSYPDFVPIDIEQSLVSSVSQEEYDNKKNEVDAIIDEVMDSIFGTENMRAYPSIYPFLCVALASHLHHFTEINRMVPLNEKLCQTPLFTNPRVMELKQHVRICMPWDSHAIYFAETSGLSHTMCK